MKRDVGSADFACAATRGRLRCSQLLLQQRCPLPQLTRFLCSAVDERYILSKPGLHLHHNRLAFRGVFLGQSKGFVGGPRLFFGGLQSAA